MECKIEKMRPEDYNAVVEIYREGIRTGVATFEPDAPSWEAWDQGHHPCCRWVIRDGDRVMAWAALSRVSPRHCYRGVAEESIYVDPACAGQGLGRMLLNHLVEDAQANGFWTLEAKIIRANQGSIILHEKCGFRIVGVREQMGHMPDGTWHDVTLMEYRSATVGRE